MGEDVDLCFDAHARIWAPYLAFDLAEVLTRVHNILEVRLLHLETRRLYDRVVAEQKVSERLLRNVLPHCIAERLKGRPEVAAGNFTEVIAVDAAGEELGHDRLNLAVGHVEQP